METDPDRDDYAAYMKLAERFRDIEKYTSPEQCIDRAIEANPNHYWAYILKGLRYRSAGMHSEAAEYLERSAGINPGSSFALSESAKLYLELADYSSAEEAFRRTLELNPSHMPAYAGLIRSLLMQGKYGESVKILSRACRLDENFYWLYRDSFREKLSPDYYEQERNYFNKTPIENTDDCYALIEMGIANAGLGNKTEAEAAFKKALKLNPGCGAAFYELGLLLRSGSDPLAAEKYLKNAVASDESSASALLELGLMYFHLEKYSDAEQALLRVIKLNPGLIRPYSGLLGVYAAKGLNGKTEAVLRDLSEIKSSPLQFWDYGSLRREFSRSGKYSLMEEELNEQVMNFSHSFRTYGDLADWYRSEGESAKADEYYRKALQSSQMTDPEFFSGGLEENYLGLYRILSRRNIEYVCAQYPLKDPDPLKKIFSGEDDIIFVNNKKVFEEAVKQHGYSEIFLNRFAGDFGHCTGKGNRILGENIGRTLMDEKFSRLKVEPSHNNQM